MFIWLIVLARLKHAKTGTCLFGRTALVFGPPDAACAWHIHIHGTHARRYIYIYNMIDTQIYVYIYIQSKRCTVWLVDFVAMWNPLLYILWSFQASMIASVLVLAALAVSVQGLRTFAFNRSTESRRRWIHKTIYQSATTIDNQVLVSNDQSTINNQSLINYIRILNWNSTPSAPYRVCFIRFWWCFVWFLVWQRPLQSPAGDFLTALRFLVQHLLILRSLCGFLLFFYGSTCSFCDRFAFFYGFLPFFDGSWLHLLILRSFYIFKKNFLTVPGSTPHFALVLRFIGGSWFNTCSFCARVRVFYRFYV